MSNIFDFFSGKNFLVTNILGNKIWISFRPLIAFANAIIVIKNYVLAFIYVK